MKSVLTPAEWELVTGSHMQNCACGEYPDERCRDRQVKLAMLWADYAAKIGQGD